ncbi:MAG: urate hydroxylase PuuD [Neomegalonema sp.]|nr:urate hydroxylase PuuD [Neomegalonema sp.]
MSSLLHEWANLIFRWAHIIAGVSWIGSSFYFMWLDSSLKRRAGMDEGVRGENWTVHGGGFYHTQKYMVAPEAMPDDLHWFRWESYMTWLTGFALLTVIYYFGASSFLIDKSVADLTPRQAVLISIACLVCSWVVYDWLCISPLRHRPALLFVVLYVLLTLATYGLSHVFAPRAVFIHIGAMIATMMSGNVFFVIIPNQRVVVADLKAGRTPDARYGQIAKLRSTHNNYLTLPVFFLMISNHYPMTFGHAHSWVFVIGVLALGGVVRNWFNLHEAGKEGVAVAWQWPTAALLAAGLMTFSEWRPDAPSGVKAPSGAEAMAILTTHCVSCHAARPAQPGFAEAPGGVRLETVAEARRHAARIAAQAVATKAMPLGNKTGMTPEERAKLGAWLAAGAPE